MSAWGRALPCCLVIFGASGDLTQRKLLPAIADLAEHELLDPRTAIIGVARSGISEEEFRDRIVSYAPGSSNLRAIASNSTYVAGDFSDPRLFAELKQALQARKDSTQGNVLYYLAIAPELFGKVVPALAEGGLPTKEGNGGFVRIVVEKPFGNDLESAKALQERISSVFDESQIFRIDHYMGKETLLNILVVRFANAVFEPIWNRHYVDCVQILVAESLGVEHRGSFYDATGALRDIVQNHVMQIMTLTLMEPPAVLQPEDIRNEKVKLLKSVRPPEEDIENRVVAGQYGRGTIDGQPVLAYLEEDGVKPGSRRETFVALRLEAENWRLAGVPILIRTGKRLKKTVTQVSLTFKRPPHSLFESGTGFSAYRRLRDLKPDRLVVTIQPDHSIALYLASKRPGYGFELTSSALTGLQPQSAPPGEPEQTPAAGPEAYSRLLLEALQGDHSLFLRQDEVMEAWRIVDPIAKAIDQGQVGISPYPAGSWGPAEADRVLEREKGQFWHNPD